MVGIVSGCDLSIHIRIIKTSLPDLMDYILSYTVSWKAKFSSWVFHETVLWYILGNLWSKGQVQKNVTLCMSLGHDQSA